MLEHVAETAEGRRLATSASEDSAWRRWGPYLSARQWGTVREDYSADGDAWSYFPFDDAHRRAFRWGEDGLGGLCDRYGFLNLAVALWNTRDDRLKERLFGLTGPQGNHGEDVKEYYWALDATPTHSWAQWLYRYPQATFPYRDLVETNAGRGQDVDEYELSDTGILAEDRFFDVVVTHAKASPTDVCVVYEATNHGPDPAPLHLVPQLWLRNTWTWGRDKRRSSIQDVPTEDARGHARVEVEHAWLHRYTLCAEGDPRVLWCDNETNTRAVFGTEQLQHPFPKDAVDRALVHGDDSLLSPDPNGTKVAFQYVFDAVAPGETVRVRLRLTAGDAPDDPFGAAFDETLAQRRAEADEFYAAVIPADVDDNDRLVARRAFAGLNWGKQVYRYSVREWLLGDPGEPPPPMMRCRPEEDGGRNTTWENLDLADVMSMPDDWEYPWFATWDLAFHCVALAHIDPAFAKQQLLLITREWAQHPDGQLPAYEWNFSDVNPPVHAWAAWLVHLADGGEDTDFLIRVMNKLTMNFSWWVNRKDQAGNELFEGGFLGMDNISLFDRSRAVPEGQRLEQSDATSWVAFKCLSLLRISQDLARDSSAYGDLATTFLERFLAISQAVANLGNAEEGLWDDVDGFFYDILVDESGRITPVRVRSLVGFVPMLAVATIESAALHEIPDLEQRLAWLRRHRPDLLRYLMTQEGESGKLTLSLVDRERYQRLVSRLFDEGEFLSPYGIRSLSAAYRDGVDVQVGEEEMHLQYAPGYGVDRMFGGNSNWRGPIWFPLNCLIVDALRARAEGVGGGFTVELPTGSGNQVGLAEAADQLKERLLDLFRPDASGRRPGTPRDFPSGPLWDCHPTFAEHFHGDTGVGLGATHQTGWTAMVAHLICRRTEDPDEAPSEESTPTPVGETDQPSPASS